ncbi:uncharacterized protein FIBRA_02532 [Fibroporia radiculosa]|uniref:NAD(P)-binding protein n=1 Tax=Fibroporia radiculosa TaxID=599839 RepID=J4G1T2_9APHY|nr:uncharacterized protein FIBRA_02532 [Fibroporia radiculosa]CCM00498.1 predicted protein [Fibroporia radiculosa]
MVCATHALAAVGAIALAPQIVRFASFVWLYLIRPSTVRRYHHGPPAYALVTGASDGIGKAVAQELSRKGFNVIIHGRNEEKVRKVAEEIRSCSSRDVRYFIADAAQPGHDFLHMIEPLSNLNITVVIHNVGGAQITDRKLDGFDESELLGLVQWNSLFPLLLTRALLPQLRSSAKTGPVMVQFVGSHVGDHSPPRLPVYAGTKAFLRALSRGLDTDERVWGADTGVRFAYLVVGSVCSSTNRTGVRETLSMPSTERFGRALVSQIGCGRRRYAPYMPHAIIQWVMDILGERLVDKLGALVIRRIVAAEEKDK